MGDVGRKEEASRIVPPNLFQQSPYDRIGTRTSLTDRLGLHQVGYDALNRLTSVDHPLASGLVDEAFTYDPVGNRTSSHLSALHRYEAANRLLEDDQFLYTYDENGNLIQKREKATGATTTYTYNVENQLIQIDLPDGRIARYRYDGLGRRIEKNVAGAITRYLYDQEDIVALFAGPTNCQTHAFLHGPGIDQPLAFVKDTNNDCNPFSDAVGLREPIVYLQSDGLGSTTSLVSETGGFFRGLFLAERVTYDSFGMPTITGPGPDNQMGTADDVSLSCSAYGNPFLFTGREYDCESGLYYDRDRYYDPTIGRFIQEDRWAGDDVHPQQKYLYAEGNPTNLVDPGGRQAQVVAVGLGAACFATVAGALICTAAGVAAAYLLAEIGKVAVQTAAAVGATVCRFDKAKGEEGYPADPDEWVPPEGVKEEPKAAEQTGGAKRHWKDQTGETIREWHKGQPGKPGSRGRDHWHDANRPGEHIPPNQ